MKTTLPLISCLLLIFTFATPISLPAAAAAAAAVTPDPVLDTTGKKLRTGVDYYILPVFRGRGGGLTLSTTPNKTTCPLAVVQAPHEIDNGLPLAFSPVDSKKGAIRVSTDLNIKFSGKSTACVQSTVWKLDKYDESTGEYFVTSGGVEGNPGRETVSNWFKVEKYENDYKLVFCPMVCNYCKVICRDVGIFVDNGGRRRLALSDVPFRVMFKNALLPLIHS